MTTNGHKVDLKPNSVEAEEALIGALLIDVDAIVQVIGLGIGGADFYIERWGWIFDAILNLWRNGKPTDLITLCDELERRGKLATIGGAATLTRLINDTPSSLWAEHYAKIVKRYSIQRQLIRASGEIAKLAHGTDQDDPSQILAEAGDILLNVSKSNSRNDPKPIGDYCNQVLDRLETIQALGEGAVSGIPTGIGDLDNLLRGLQRGHLVLIAGRPTMGKSSLATQIATHTAKQGLRPLIFSLEMPGDELTGRIISAESGINSLKLRGGRLTDDEYAEFVSASVRVAQLGIAIDDRSRTIDEIRAKSIVHQAKYGLDLVIVDYVQRVTTGQRHQNRDAEIGYVSSMLKQMALNDLNIPVIAVASLSRKCEERSNKRPILSDLRESGNLEYDADEVLFLYRADVYDSDEPPVAEISIAKHRGGALGTVKTFFQKELTIFKPLIKNTVDFSRIGD